MRTIDSHSHWAPKKTFELLWSRHRKHSGSEIDGDRWWTQEGGVSFTENAIWTDLDVQFEHMNRLGYDMDLIGWVGPSTPLFSDLPPEEGRDLATAWNEDMAGGQRKYAGRFWGTAAVPLQNIKVALEVLDHAAKLGLVGANLPGIIGKTTHIDAEYLEPFYQRLEEIGMPLFVHPTDAALRPLRLDEKYGGALTLTLGRVIDSSLAAMQLILSGIMERHPNLKVFMSHTAGVLPYQAGRMDKNGPGARLPKPPSSYIKRLYTDTVNPHTPGIKFAIEYFGVDQVMFGSDFPCWNHREALDLFDAIELSDADRTKILSGNARRFFNLPDPLRKLPDPLRKGEQLVAPALA
jgi:aminocarboxymuconate-semialdehyde decarboxylase